MALREWRPRYVSPERPALHVSVHIEHLPSLDATVVDASAQVLLLQVAYPLSKGTAVSIELRSPGGPVELQGRVEGHSGLSGRFARVRLSEEQGPRAKQAMAELAERLSDLAW